ncbi:MULTISPECIES: transcriptional regulator [unclassified Serratia (in: enterobacteria)]|uniref:transcriptional regulator n=1 Tax=unclassified Serratia (in: enterobacteria) TaxID=2647522 RepID=UPI002ED2F4FB|nr:winged helix-turn-helix domain-containing protein [Serratia sp. C2(2)]MEE4449674.1 winged helix-turn-helix domain-containing protein [Serratia sp. C2(1)]
MKYIIALSIVFTPATRTLMLLNDEQRSILLSNQASRLLLEMVTNNHSTLSREDLLQRVWEDYGFKRSNNSLNVAISEIRKCFEVLGRDPQLITTIPKVGFKFNATVDPRFDEGEEKDNEAEAPPALPVNINTEEKRNLDLPARKNSFFFNSLIALTLLVIICFFAYWKFSSYIRVNTQPVTLLYEYKKCKVYGLGLSSGNAKDELTKMARADLQLARNDLQSESIDCARTNFDIYYNKTRPNNQLSKVTLIGACERDDNGNQGQCISIIGHYGETQ